jgi:hypothetical protein
MDATKPRFFLGGFWFGFAFTDAMFDSAERTHFSAVADGLHWPLPK